MSGSVSPLPWTGSKGCIYTTIDAFMPPHKTYVEACMGSAEVFLRKKPAEREIINDYNGDLVKFFRVLQQNEKLAYLLGRLYNAIASAVQQHTKMPSFLSRTAGKAQTVELSWDGSRYCAELTDNNGVIGNFNYSVPGMNCVVSGNKLIITSNSAPTDKVTLTAEKKSSQRRGLIIWSDCAYQPGNGNQDTVTFGQQVDDPRQGIYQFDGFLRRRQDRQGK